MSEPREGWYVAYMADGRERCVFRSAGWWFVPKMDQMLGPASALPYGWILGPRLDDLLRDAAAGRTQLNEIALLRRDAARYRWLSGVSTVGLRALNWDSKDTGKRGKLIDAEIARERGE